MRGETPRIAPAGGRRPEVVRTIADLRARVLDWRRRGETTAMVPTMGALHEGHLSLVREGFRRADHVVVTIFVNPTQFAPHEDFQSYPRTEAHDLELLTGLSADLVFAPNAAEMYPLGFATRIEPQGAALGLETEFRPHFFGGVATVVAKLLLAGLPDIAIFGEKDFQQLAVVRQMVRDLNIPTEIVGAPTMREADGLALSSRNAYLTAGERAAAPILYATMTDAARRIRAGEPAATVLVEGSAAILDAGFDKVDYLTLRDAASLAAVEHVSREPLRLLVAAWIGRTRLIDNIAV
ncbi:pantoate--beta-alanine ligase [Methyloraptor flagellatus]|uniref:Pantothenate synthetase n=1 Tax=Methyloraptor flagellatus TaxID=3162530 RepID=A0AAU7XG42_9HYPH